MDTIYTSERARSLIFDPTSCFQCGSFTIYRAHDTPEGNLYECCDCGAEWTHGFRVVSVVNVVREPTQLPPEPEPHSPAGWRDHLTWDDAVSASSPVICGTWVTVDHVVALIVDGWTWSDILKTHPELSEGDVRACLAYSVETWETVG